MQLKFFLSSSSEQLFIAEALEANLKQKDILSTLWSRGAHGASEYNLESILKQAHSADFAIFIFAADDRVTIRGQAASIVRDNVLFELGIFIGSLGRERCFILKNIEHPMRMPTDLQGITTIQYDPRLSNGNHIEAIESTIAKIIETASATAKVLESKFSKNDLKLLRSCKDSSPPSIQAYKISYPEEVIFDDKLCMRFLRLLEHRLIQTNGATEVEATSSGNLLADYMSL
jgi:hypothetical protein